MDYKMIETLKQEARIQLLQCLQEQEEKQVEEKQVEEQPKTNCKKAEN